MSILVNKQSRVIVQGITGKEGSFHAEQMIEYGTSLAGGVTPGKGGQTHLNRPVFNSVYDAVSNLEVNVSVIFVPPPFASDAIMEAADAGVKTIVTITEGIPQKDLVQANDYVKARQCVLVGPNCPGIITPGECKAGIMPGSIFERGPIGVISRSGTLTYEIAYQIVQSGLGVSTAVGIGGDAITGTTTQEVLALFLEDEETKAVVLIGEIGGSQEVEAAHFLREKGNSKPVVGFIAGQTAPKGKRMGHAGAIVGGVEDTAAAKMKVLEEHGIHVSRSPAEVGRDVAAQLKSSTR